MSDAIYEWMKNLAVFYIFLTAVMNLLPDKRYGEYIKFFMGLLLILLVLAPLLQLLNLKDSVGTLFQQKMLEEEYLESQWGDLTVREDKTSQQEYLMEGYTVETQRNIKSYLEQKGYEVISVAAQLYQGDKLSVESMDITISGGYDYEKEAALKVELEAVYGTAEGKIGISFEEPQ